MARRARGDVLFGGTLRAASLLTIGSLALLTSTVLVPARAALPLPPAAPRGARLARRSAVHPIDHRLAERAPSVRHAPVHHWVHPAEYRHLPVHTVLRHSWHPVVHAVRGHERLERAERIVHPVVRRTGWHPPARVLRMSCVPFARADSGIDLSGDAYAWWTHAAGTYARGDVPVPGSVLAFRANVRMRLGHVAVVSRVVNRREIEVDQANWGDGGRITRGVPVIDVSEDNDWTDVRVALGDGRFGSVYPTYGFIYDRPDTGTMVARARTPAPEVAANPAPSNLRALRRSGDEVAELPGRLPAPPHWPAHLGHTLHTDFAHREVRHVAYRRPVTHWAPHHAVIHHVVLHRVALRHSPAPHPDSPR